MEFISNLIISHKKKFISIILLAALAIGSSYLLGPDNPVEQGAEVIIKEETGVDLDFSPEK